MESTFRFFHPEEFYDAVQSLRSLPNQPCGDTPVHFLTNAREALMQTVFFGRVLYNRRHIEPNFHIPMPIGRVTIDLFSQDL